VEPGGATQEELSTQKVVKTILYKDENNYNGHNELLGRMPDLGKNPPVDSPSLEMLRCQAGGH